MCVISIIENENQIPSYKMSKKMFTHNPHGSGLMVYDELKKHIYVKKGMDLKQINKMTLKQKAKGNLNMIQHYRIASVGSHDNKLLNQGFAIGNNIKNKLEFTTNNDVLAHNGTIDMDILNDMATNIMIKNPNAVYPSGELSDTLLLSWILYFVDYSVLNMFTSDNRFTIMNGKTGKITKYGNWNNVKDKKHNLITSNNYFDDSILYDEVTYLDDFNDSYMGDYLTKDEDKELKRLYKKYNNMFDSEKDIIEQYLSYGMSVYDIEEQIKSEDVYGGYV